MRLLQRAAGAALLAALCILPVGALAQDNDTIKVGGSGIAAPLFSALVEASGVESAIETTVSGTSSGLSALCEGGLDAALATRAINDVEDATCAAAGVGYVEVLLGYNAAAFIVNVDGEALTCVDTFSLSDVFAPSAAGTPAQWVSFDPSLSSNPLTLALPPSNTTAYAQLDGVVSGDGLRTDITSLADEAAVIEAVKADANTFGVVSLAAAQAAEGIKVLDVSQGATCYPANADALENGSYVMSQPLYLYVNAASLEKVGFKDVLTFAVGADAGEAVRTAGYVTVSDTARQTNITSLADGIIGRTFSQPEPTYAIAPNVSGAVALGGSPSVITFVDTLVQGTIAQAYPSLTATLNFEGMVAGARRLCNGELDILAADRALTEEELANCEANAVTTFDVVLGSQAVVMVASADADYLSCVKVEQLPTIWAASADAATTWNQVDSAWADAPMYLFASNFGDIYGDLLLSKVAGGLVLREPTELNADPLYRAAAVANAGSGLTYMRLQDYTRALEIGQTGIQLVAVDAGNGCVVPSVETIQDGSYALARTVTLKVTETAVENEPTKSLLWLMFADTNYSSLALNGFTGVTLGDFAATRELLLEKFDEATARVAAREALQLQSTPQATPEGEGENTEATPTPSN